MGRPIKISVLADTNRAQKQVQSFGASLKRSLGVATGLAGIGGLTAGIVGFAKSAVSAEKAFSTTMRMTQVNTKASAAEMKQLNALALKLGADTSFSAGEAADAMLELAKAGLDTKTIMGGGLSGTLQLAAAGGTDLAAASTIASNALNTFKLSGKDMASVAAALAGGANASTASVESLGQALQQVGPGATNAGLSLQETVAALAAFDSAGIKGSDAGTSLKTMLARLVPTTKAAATAMDNLGLDFVKGNGEFESLTNIAEQLRTRLGKLAPAQRQVALQAIFGSDATRAATVLMNEGATGIRKYIKATKDQDAAQEAANARMNGTEGALERLSGAIETAQLRLGQEFAPMIVKGADALGDHLVPAMEGGIEAGKKIARALAPAASEIAEALSHLAGEGDGVGRMFNDVFIPALRTASELVGGAVDLVDNLPGPLKEVGVQAAIAALVLPRFQAGVASATGAVSLQIAKLQQLRAEMTYTATRTQITGQMMERLSGAAKTAAGVGGMLALAQGAQTTNQSVSGLLTTLGGAATGFAIAGPIGGLVGGLGGLATAAFKTKEAAEQSMTTWQTYASTLDNVTGATTRATEAMVIQELRNQKVLNIAGQLGIDRATLVSGILGEKGARDELAKAIAAEAQAIKKLEATDWDNISNEQNYALSAELDSRRKNLAALREEVGEVQKATKAKREDLLVLAGFPDVAITRIETPGAVDSKRELAELAATYNLTPKQIKTAIEVIGRDKIKASKAEVVALQQQLIKSGNVKPGNAWSRFFSADLANTAGKARTGKANLNGLLSGIGNTKSSGKWKQGFQIDLSESTRNASKGKTILERVLGDTGKNVKPNLAPFGRSLGGKIQALQGPARSKGDGVGLNIGAGMYGGLNRWVGPLATRAYTMVREAIAAANRAGDIHSPSLETDYTGRMLGAGLAQGIESQHVVVTRAGEKSGKAALKGIMRGVTSGASGIDAALGRVTKLVEKRITGKNQGKREKAILKSLQGQFNALRANGKAQEALASGNYLPYLKAGTAAQRRLYQDMRNVGVKNMDEARQKVTELTDAMRDYRQGILDTIKATGDITQLGRQEDGTVSITSLLSQLDDKAKNALRFEDLVTKFAKQGLYEAQINQLLAAGPESALATAEAIELGGQAAIDEMNRLQTILGNSGDRLGKAMADKYKLAGVQAAQGVVTGLEKESARIDAAAVRLANALVKAVKKALGIKSPSRVFMGVGDNVIKGLDIGLDDTYVKRSGAVLASSLQKGFGTPALDALASMPAGGTEQVVELRISADGISELEQGKKLIRRIDFARQSGVRSETLR